MSDRILLLPYRKARGGREFLLRREHMEHWDAESDICAISMPVGARSLEEAVLFALEATSGYDAKESELIRLGLVMADRSMGTTIHLFAIDLSEKSGEALPAHYDESGEMTFWTDTEELMKSIDPGLLSAYARLKYLFN